MDKLLSVQVAQVLENIGMKTLQHPIFYHCPIGIRFEISAPWGEVYLQEDTEERIVNPAYVDDALEKAKAIFHALPSGYDILQLMLYPDETDIKAMEAWFCEVSGLPAPKEILQTKKTDDDGEEIPQLQLFWDLQETPFDPVNLLREIIKGDLGGESALVSSGYFWSTRENVLFYLYDDRGADLVAEKRETLLPIYRKYHDWILDYDCEKIEQVFEGYML